MYLHSIKIGTSVISLCILLSFVSCLPILHGNNALETEYFAPVTPQDSLLPKIDNLVSFICKESEKFRTDSIYMSKFEANLLDSATIFLFETCLSSKGKTVVYTNEMKYPYIELEVIYDSSTNLNVLNLGIMYKFVAGNGTEYELVESNGKFIIGKYVDGWRTSNR